MVHAKYGSCWLSFFVSKFGYRIFKVELYEILLWETIAISRYLVDICGVRNSRGLAPASEVAGVHTIPFLNWQTMPF
jgi:hypothetical protein